MKVSGEHLWKIGKSVGVTSSPPLISPKNLRGLGANQGNSGEFRGALWNSWESSGDSCAP